MYQDTSSITEFMPSLSDLETKELMMLVSSAAEAKGVAPNIILGPILAAIGTSVQGAYNLISPTGRTLPLPLNITVIAPPASGKSTAFDFAFKPIYQWQAEKDREYENEKQDFDTKSYIFELNLKKARREIIYGKNKDEKNELLIENMLKNRPTPPKRTRVIYESISATKLKNGLYEHGNNAIIATSEGGNISKSLREESSLLNALYQGETVTYSTGRKGMTVTLKDSRLSCIEMYQNDLFDEDMPKSKAIKNGHNERKLFIIQKSLPPQISHNHNKTEVIGKEKYDRRIQDLLNKTSKYIKRIDVPLGLEAIQIHREASLKIQQQMSEGGIYEEFGSHAMRTIENMMRVAGNISIFYFPDSRQVTASAMRDAIKICLSCSKHYIEKFGLNNQYNDDYNKLLEYLKKLIRKDNFFYVEKNHVRTYGPNSLRDSKKLDVLLRDMQNNGIIFLYKDKNQPEMINLSPLRSSIVNMPRMVNNLV